MSSYPTFSFKQIWPHISTAKLKFGSLVALYVGLMVVFTNYKETTQKKQVMLEGISTSAVATAKISRRGGYELDIEYAVQSGPRRTERVRVSEDLYGKVESQPIINIKYLSKDPSRVIIVGESIEDAEKYAIGGVIFALGAAGTWWFFVRKRPVKQVAPPVMPANA